MHGAARLQKGIKVAEMNEVKKVVGKVRKEVSELQKLQALFNKNYDKIYKNEGSDDMGLRFTLCEIYHQYSITFGVLILIDKAFQKKVQQFVAFRGDVLSSDRECAAFVAAYYGKKL